MFKLKAYSIIIITVVLFYANISSAGLLSFDDKSGTFPADCISEVSMALDTQGQDVIGADIKVFFNPNEIEIKGFNISSGVFQSYLEPKELTGYLGENKGKNIIGIFVAGNNKINAFNGVGKIGKLLIKNKPGVEQAQLSYYVLPNRQAGEDSNLSSISGGVAGDILDGGDTQTIVFQKGLSCPSHDTSNTVGVNTSGKSVLKANPNYIEKFPPSYQMYYWIGGILLLLLVIYTIYKITKNKDNKQTIE